MNERQREAAGAVQPQLPAPIPAAAASSPRGTRRCGEHVRGPRQRRAGAGGRRARSALPPPVRNPAAGPISKKKKIKIN